MPSHAEYLERRDFITMCLVMFSSVWIHFDNPYRTFVPVFVTKGSMEFTRKVSACVCTYLYDIRAEQEESLR